LFPDLIESIEACVLMAFLRVRIPNHACPSNCIEMADVHSCVLTQYFEVTGPVARFARQISGQGYIVAAPSSYHEFTGPEPLAYDVPGTDAGNEWKIKKVNRLIHLHILHPGFKT
jgi:hypothetical protein